MLDALPLIPAEPNVGGMTMLALALLVVGGVIGALLGYRTAENER